MSFEGLIHDPNVIKSEISANAAFQNTENCHHSHMDWTFKMSSFPHAGLFTSFVKIEEDKIVMDHTTTKNSECKYICNLDNKVYPIKNVSKRKK